MLRSYVCVMYIRTCTYTAVIYKYHIDEEVIAAWNNPTQSDSSWQATVQMAWQISAHLVFQLSVRYLRLYIYVGIVKCHTL